MWERPLSLWFCAPPFPVVCRTQPNERRVNGAAPVASGFASRRFRRFACMQPNEHSAASRATASGFASHRFQWFAACQCRSSRRRRHNRRRGSARWIVCCHRPHLLTLFIGNRISRWRSVSARRRVPAKGCSRRVSCAAPGNGIYLLCLRSRMMKLRYWYYSPHSQKMQAQI